MADILKKGGRPCKYPGDAVMPDVIRAYETEGATSKALAEKYGVKPSTIRAWILRYKQRNKIPASSSIEERVCQLILSYQEQRVSLSKEGTVWRDLREEDLQDLREFMIKQQWIR